MNKALTIQANAVQRNGGMVDKYIGDAMMAIFNAPMDLQDHEHIAVKTGLQIRDEIKEAKLGIDIGIGINSGPAVVGNMGSDSRFDYSAIGDAVNTVFRIQDMCRSMPNSILASEMTLRAARSQPEVHPLMGCPTDDPAENIKIYEVVGR